MWSDYGEGQKPPKEHDDKDAEEKSESDDWFALSEQGPMI